MISVNASPFATIHKCDLQQLQGVRGDGDSAGLIKGIFVRIAMLALKPQSFSIRTFMCQHADWPFKKEGCLRLLGNSVKRSDRVTSVAGVESPK